MEVGVRGFGLMADFLDCDFRSLQVPSWYGLGFESTSEGGQMCCCFFRPSTLHLGFNMEKCTAVQPSGVLTRSLITNYCVSIVQHQTLSLAMLSFVSQRAGLCFARLQSQCGKAQPAKWSRDFAPTRKLALNPPHLKTKMSWPV